MQESVTMRRPLDGERIDRRLAIIRDLFGRSAALRPDARAAYPPVPEADLAALEARHGLRLPENYRRYLLEFGEPGGALMNYGPRGLADQPGPRSALPFPLDAPWAGFPSEITEWEEEQEGDFFEDGPGEAEAAPPR
ncbi:SMI1/KNR4 family protein [Nocardia sp. NPDC050697]|uniref:SMI1/KNR4 family protein n=1 Tax=Nocardia sp. NPDC050697 TaxID=3155158 RepID=UPI0033D0D5D7